MVNHSAAAGSSAALDAAFAALSDPTRRAMVERLTRSPATAGELAAPFDMSLPAVSKHLRVLEDAGLLTRQVEGRTHRMTLRTEALRAANMWLDFHLKFWETRLDALDRFLQETESESTENSSSKKTSTKKVNTRRKHGND
jgi:DNA-binding transcriptional ArsR family regulator